MRKSLGCALVLATVLPWTGIVVRAQKQNDAADTARLVEVLELKPGSNVADIGAGSGELTILLAREVGETGRVYSTDINPTRLQEIPSHRGPARDEREPVGIAETWRTRRRCRLRA